LRAGPVLSTAISGSLPPHQVGLGSGINSITHEIGGALGVAPFGSLLGSRFPAHLPPLVRDAPGLAG